MDFKTENERNTWTILLRNFWKICGWILLLERGWTCARASLSLSCAAASVRCEEKVVACIQRNITSRNRQPATFANTNHIRRMEGFDNNFKQLKWVPWNMQYAMLYSDDIHYEIATNDKARERSTRNSNTTKTNRVQNTDEEEKRVKKGA